MSIDKERGLYKCFACCAGGDVFQFIHEYRHLKTGQPKFSYPQAIQIVIHEYLPQFIANHIMIPKQSSTTTLPPSSSSTFEELQQRNKRQKE